MNEVQLLQTQPNSVRPMVPLAVEQIGDTDTQTLRRHLAQSLTLTAQALTYTAAIWAELERRGEDLSELRSGMAIYLPLIARGVLDAEVIVKHAGQRMLIKTLSQFPLAQQRQLVEAGKVPVVKIDDEGDVVREMTSLLGLPALDIRFVFDERGVRSEAAQIRLRQKHRAIKARSRVVTARKIEVEEDANAVKIGNTRILVAKILPALSKLYGFDVEALIEREMTTHKALDAVGKMK